MELQALIVQANKTYDLGLDQNGINALLSKMRMMGHNPTIGQSHISSTLDAILVKADDLKPKKRRSRNAPSAVYANLKVEAAPQVDENCPRCKTTEIKTVKLVGGRTAAYCQTCRIALPIKVE